MGDSIKSPIIHYYRQINKRVVTKTTIKMLTNHKSITARAQYLFHTITTKNHQKKPPEYHQRIQKTPKKPENRRCQVSLVRRLVELRADPSAPDPRYGSTAWSPVFFLPGLQGFTIGKSSIRKLGT